jgi:hypothetical protein
MPAPQAGQAFQFPSTVLPQAGQVCFRFFPQNGQKACPVAMEFPQPGHFSGPALPSPPSILRLTGVSLRTMA